MVTLSFNIDIDTDEINEAMNKIKETIKNRLQDDYAQALADQLFSNILFLINEGEWETINGGPTYGIVDTGDYKSSWDTYYDDLSKVMHVGSIDPKAPLIEDGSTPEDNSNLKDETIIAWCRRNQIPNPKKNGIIIARTIRKYGTPPKPVLRQALSMLESQAEEVKQDLIRQYQSLA